MRRASPSAHGPRRQSSPDRYKKPRAGRCGRSRSRRAGKQPIARCAMKRSRRTGRRRRSSRRDGGLHTQFRRRSRRHPDSLDGEARGRASRCRRRVVTRPSRFALGDRLRRPSRSARSNRYSAVADTVTAPRQPSRPSNRTDCAIDVRSRSLSNGAPRHPATSRHRAVAGHHDCSSLLPRLADTRSVDRARPATGDVALRRRATDPRRVSASVAPGSTRSRRHLCVARDARPAR